MDKDGSGEREEAETRALEWEEGDSDTRRSRRTQAAERPYQPDYTQPGRQPSSEREHAFNSLAWMLEGATGLMEELRHSDLGLSEEFWVHALAARREGLLALRAVLDELIEKSTQQTRQDAERQQRRERRGGIDIDF